MTPATPEHLPPDVPERVVALLDFLARAGIGVAAFYASMQGVVKPFLEFRRAQREKQAAVLAEQVKAILKPDLDRLNAIVGREETCADQNEKILARQTEIFRDMALFLEISQDNRERHDETSELLNQVFGLDRRIDLEQRKRIDTLLHELRTKTKERREAGDFG